VAVTDQFELDLQAMEKRAGSHISLVYICNPQNPTGAMTPYLQLRPFCRRVSRNALVILDEAYHDYVDDPAYASMVDLVRKGDNILVTRTFSKIFGLAGLRIGYGLARPDIIKNLLQLERNFAPVSSLSLRAAIASYKDKEFVRKARRQNKDVKSYMCNEIRRLGFAFIPSHTNFVIFRVQRDSHDLAKELEARSVLIRPFKFRGADWIRASLGTLGEMQTFIAHLEDLDRAELGVKTG
jgi:histidinol-phosphate aminotransferase